MLIREIQMKMPVNTELVVELRQLSAPQQRQVLDFVHFIRVKDAIDPRQAYFWTRQWQQLERKADRAKAEGKLLGDGSVRGLLSALHRKP